MSDNFLKQMLSKELGIDLDNIIYQDEDGSYKLFGKYTLTPADQEYQVYRNDDFVGNFRKTSTALCWCVADKYNHINLAHQLLTLDRALNTIVNDIYTRAGVAAKARRADVSECIEVKLESKIIRKKVLEKELAKCVKSAKYLQQKGFNNETSRFVRNTTNKTSV